MMEKKQRIYSVYSKNKNGLYCSFFVFFLDAFGWTIAFPLLAPLLIETPFEFFAPHLSTDFKNLLIGYLFSAYPLAQFFGAPFFGGIADRFGRKKAFLYSITGTIFSYLFSTIAIVLHSYVLLLLSRFCAGFFSGVLNISLTVIADVSKVEKDRTRHFNILATLGGLAWVVSAFLSADFSNPALLRFFHPTFPFLFATFLSIIAFFVIRTFFRETRTPLPRKKISFFKGFQNIKTAFSEQSIQWIFGAYFLWITAWIIALSWFGSISVEWFHWSEETISYMLMANGLIWMAVNLFSYHYAIKRFSLSKITFFGYSLSAIFLFLAMQDNPFMYATCFLLATAFLSLLWGSILAIISIHLPPNLQGIAFGLSQSVFSLGIIIGPILAGYLSHLGRKVPYYFASGILLVGLLFLVIWFSTRHKKLSASTTP